MVNTAALIDLGYRGLAFTWSNNQHNGNLILQRLDRVLASTTWTAIFPSAAVYHLPCFNSNHNLILLRTSPPPPKIQKALKLKIGGFITPNSKTCVQMLYHS